MKKIVGILLLVLSSFSAVSEFSSLSWQKLRLEREYQKEISDVVKGISIDIKHIVDVKLELKEIDEPEFSKSSSPNKQGDRSPAGNEEKNTSKSVVNFTDDPGVERRVEKVVLAKFGIMAPLVDDFTISRKKEALRAPASNGGGQSSAPPINEVEEKFKVLNSLDIFKYIKSASARVVIDSNIDENLKKAYEDTFKNLKWEIGGISFTPSIEFKQLSSSQSVKKKTFFEHIKEFEVITAIVLGSLIFLLTMLMFAKKLEEVFKKKSGGESSVSSPAPANSQDSTTEQEKKIIEDDFDHLNLGGVERFLHFFSSFPEEGKLMIQSWLKTDSEETTLKMNAIAQKLDNNDLAKVLSKLSNDERNDWKSCLGDRLEKDQMMKADFLISQDVLHNMVSPSSNMAPHVFDVMVSLSAENAARFVQDHVELSPILYSELNSKIMSDIIKYIDEETVEKMIELSLTFEPSENTEKYSMFEVEIIKYHHDKVRLPGMKKIGEILTNVNPGNELSIFKTIANVAGAPVVRESALSKFPTFLFKKLPEELLKNIIVSYQITKRVNLIYSLGDDGAFYLDIYAPEGSRAREMFELEVEKIEMDKSLQKQIVSNKDEIWQDFVSFTRKKIEEDSEFEEEIREVLNKWIGENSSDSQAAA